MRIESKSKILISVIIFASIFTLIFYLFYMRQVAETADCSGDVCMGMVDVYINADNKSTCRLVGGQYEERYNGWGGYIKYCLAN